MAETQLDFLEKHFGRLENAWIVPIGPNYAVDSLRAAWPESQEDRGINFNYILETGNIPSASFSSDARSGRYSAYSEELGEGWWGSQKVDWKADDKFNEAMDDLFESVKSEIDSSEPIFDLLNKAKWTFEDRELWEENISTIVSEQVDLVPGLGDYRTEGLDVGVRHQSLVNDLGNDIRVSNPKTVEFDCKIMSIVEGTLLQRIENEYLERAAPSEDFKRQSNYFYMSGDVILTPENRGGHAFIMSSATGNIIEATYDPEWGMTPYIRNIDTSMGFEDFLMNTPFVGTNGSVYGGDLNYYPSPRPPKMQVFQPDASPPPAAF